MECRVSRRRRDSRSSSGSGAEKRYQARVISSDGVSMIRMVSQDSRYMTVSSSGSEDTPERTKVPEDRSGEASPRKPAGLE